REPSYKSKISWWRSDGSNGKASSGLPSGNHKRYSGSVALWLGRYTDRRGATTDNERRIQQISVRKMQVNFGLHLASVALIRENWNREFGLARNDHAHYS